MRKEERGGKGYARGKGLPPMSGGRAWYTRRRAYEGGQVGKGPGECQAWAMEVERVGDGGQRGQGD